MWKKLTVMVLLLSLSYPLFSQSLSDLISDLENVYQIISGLTIDNENMKQQLQSLQENETQKEKLIENLETSAERREQLLAILSEQLKQQEQDYQRQTKSYERSLTRYKILIYFTAGAGVTGWILWLTNK